MNQKVQLPPPWTASEAVEAARQDMEYFRSRDLPECWYAAVVTPQQEGEAVRQLIELGYEAFVTSELRYRRKHRADKTKKGIEYPLIPGLVFVGVDDYLTLSAIWKLDIIHGFLGSGPSSSRLRAKDLIRLHDMAIEAGAPLEQVEMISREEYNIGELCEVVSGPLTGQHFTVEDITGGGRKPWRAIVTAQFFNMAKRVELPLNTLRPV